MRAWDLILVGTLLSTWPLGGEAQTIQGRVVEATSGLPVGGAEVLLSDRDDRVHGRALTSGDGAFQTRAPAEGWYSLRVSRIGYAAYLSDSIRVGSVETVTVEVRVGQTAIPLDPLVVTARNSSRLLEFHQRRTSGAFGQFITQEEIDRRSAERTTDLLRGVAGVSVLVTRTRGRTLNRVTMNGALGACEPLVFLDGMQQPRQSALLDELLAPHMVAGIEIYTSRAGAPARYADASGCGSVLVWTRTDEGDEAQRFGWKRAVIGVGAAAIAVFLLMR